MTNNEFMLIPDDSWDIHRWINVWIHAWIHDNSCTLTIKIHDNSLLIKLGPYVD